MALNQEEKQPGSFDHIPSPAELAALYANAEQNDPRSVFYKRVLVRPKFPVLGLVCVLTYIALCVTLWIVLSGWWGALACLAALVLGFAVFSKKILVTAVKIYQSVASDRVRNRCRYEPSCSAYMLLAVEKYGFCKGLRKGLKRWRGCKPPNGGYDMP